MCALQSSPELQSFPWSSNFLESISRFLAASDFYILLADAGSPTNPNLGLGSCANERET